MPMHDGLFILKNLLVQTICKKDQNSYTTIWSSNTTRLLEIAMHHFFWDTLYKIMYKVYKKANIFTSAYGQDRTPSRRGSPPLDLRHIEEQERQEALPRIFGHLSQTQPAGQHWSGYFYLLIEIWNPDENKFETPPNSAQLFTIIQTL